MSDVVPACSFNKLLQPPTETTPIHKTPTELLCHIFSLLLPSSPDPEALHAQAQTLAQTCTRWASAAYAQSELWTTLNIAWDAEYRAICLERAGVRLVTLVDRSLRPQSHHSKRDGSWLSKDPHTQALIGSLVVSLPDTHTYVPNLPYASALTHIWLDGDYGGGLPFPTPGSLTHLYLKKPNDTALFAKGNPGALSKLESWRSGDGLVDGSIFSVLFEVSPALRDVRFEVGLSLISSAIRPCESLTSILITKANYSLLGNLNQLTCPNLAFVGIYEAIAGTEEWSVGWGEPVHSLSHFFKRHTNIATLELFFSKTSHLDAMMPLLAGVSFEETFPSLTSLALGLHRPRHGAAFCPNAESGTIADGGGKQSWLGGSSRTGSYLGTMTASTRVGSLVQAFTGLMESSPASIS